MKEKIKTFFSVCVLVVAVPYIVTLLFQGSETSSTEKSIEKIKKENTQGQTVESEIDVEEYVKGVVAKQISLESEMETLKAQTVIARTMIVKAQEEGKALPESMETEELLELLGQKGFEEKYGALEEAAASTRGEILMWQEKPAEPAYHAVSAGMTRSGQIALGREDVPYMEAVESQKDMLSPNYLKVVFWEKTQVAQKLQTADPALVLNPEEIPGNIQITGRDDSGYVTQVQIGEVTLSGEQFRQYLGLNSACFYIKEVEGQVRILTKGLGHGLGLSQYGANEMAKEGKDYKEILNYYYQGLELKTY